LKTLTHVLPDRRKSVAPVLFLLGAVLLVGTWTILYWSESLFTGSHLVGYYCCVTEQDLPAHGTVERTLSDFFRTFPGMHLPSLVFVVANVGLFALAMRRGGRNYWWLPFLFIAFNVLYLLVDFQLVVLSWSISDRLVGLQTSAYKGYSRTWYGIVMHLVLWAVFFITLSGVSRKLLSRNQTIQELNGS